jgi:hypothetical protein
MVVVKGSNLWDKMTCSLLKVNRHFGGTYSLHLWCKKILITLLHYVPEDRTLFTCNIFKNRISHGEINYVYKDIPKYNSYVYSCVHDMTTVSKINYNTFMANSSTETYCSFTKTVGKKKNMTDIHNI